MRIVFLLLFIASLSCLATVANAQTVLKVNVPFDFVVRGKTLPAADYNIDRTSLNDSTGLAFVNGKEHVGIRATAIDGTLGGTRLDFLKVGSTYFLTDILTPTGTLHFPISRKYEHIAGNTGQTSTTSVAAE
jgi:hypothetical protein